MLEYSVRARFREIVSGIPVLAEWKLANTFRDNRPAYVETGTVIGVRWLDFPPVKRDTTGRPPR